MLHMTAYTLASVCPSSLCHSVSLGEFGKHLPATPTPTTASETQSTQHTHQPPSASGRGSGRSQGGGEDSAGEPPPTASMQEFEVCMVGQWMLPVVCNTVKTSEWRRFLCCMFHCSVIQNVVVSVITRSPNKGHSK